MNFSHNRSVFIIVMAMSLLLVSTLALAEEKKEPAGKAAVVNGVAISKDDFNREMDFYIKRASQQGQQVPQAQLGMMKSQVLDSLIDRELLFQETKKKGIKVDPKDVANEFQVSGGGHDGAASLNGTDNLEEILDKIIYKIKFILNN